MNSDKKYAKYFSEDLCRSLSDIGGEWRYDLISQSAQAGGDRKIDVEAKKLEFFISMPNICFDSRVWCTNSEIITLEEKRLIRDLTKLFIHDLSVIGSRLESREIWHELTGTRIIRVAARISSSETPSTLSMIKIFEAAAQQTYEGEKFTGSAVLAHNPDNPKDLDPTRFVSFGRSIEYRKAMLEEKWIRPFLMDGSFALLGGNHRKRAWGVVDIRTPWNFTPTASPIEELDGLYGYLQKDTGVSILSASSEGEIYYSTPNGFQFVKSKGRWRYRNWNGLRDVLKSLPEEVAENIFRLVRRSSYNHDGSLYVILDSRDEISRISGGYDSHDKANSVLRVFAYEGNVAAREYFRILKTASRIDGAIVMDSEGTILDVASMILSQSPEAWRKRNLEKPQTFPGARSTAAWNASLHGVAIKVSDDGPVEVFKYGRMILRIE